MPTIKIYPPSQLPDREVTETQFSIWKEELEVYLSQEADFAIFLPDQPYANWEAAEVFPDRVRDLKVEDRVQVGNGVTVDGARQQNAAKVKKIRTNLRTVLSLVGKCVSQGHYNSVMRHSTSLTGIYQMLRSDYDIQQKGIHFFNILDVKYDSSKTTPVAFYNQYRTVITNNLAKNGDVLKYKNNEELTQDEKMSPMLEDLVLLNVLHEIDSRLPSFIKTHYNHKMKRDERLMDFKSDILVNIPTFLEQLDSSDNNSIKETSTSSLKAFKPTQNRRQPRKAYKNSAQQSLYCRMCLLAKLPKEIYCSHNFGDPKCTQISFQDRQRLMETVKMSSMKSADDQEVDDEELAEMFGYGHLDDDVDHDPEEVKSEKISNHSLKHFSRTEEPTLSYIQPVPSQILTMFTDSQNKSPIHIDIDSGATVNYILETEAKKFGFKIHPNGQMSKLGDGITKLKSVGEINETFFRNNWCVKFRAIVCKHLTSPVIGGTVFIKENGVEQDFVKNVVHIHGRQVTVQATDPISILPTAPIFSTMSAKVKHNPPTQLLSFKSQVLLPGQDVSLPLDREDDAIVCVEPRVENKNSDWPESQHVRVTDGKISLRNSTSNPIILGKDVKQCQVRETKETVKAHSSYYSYKPKSSNNKEDSSKNISLIQLELSQSEKANEIVSQAHQHFHEVFNKDLSQGYNGYYGKHECHLNWATSERPPASKVRVPSYDHDLKVLQQEVMDDLTHQGVLLIPQEHGIKVQSVCPSFIQRKQRARDKSKQSLTKDDVRFLINFGPVNEKIKPVPIHVPTTTDVMIMLGRWKYIIIFDLYNGYHQNHMSKDSIPWLGVQTPFGGLRVMARSGQGLMGMAEEFDELMAKILKQELQEAICTQIVDDIVVGGETPEEAATNYYRVLAKLHLANIKVTPEKTKIFPKSADMLGWVWKEGGYLEASPHRKFALTNTKVEDIKKIQDMRSWVGLFKTLHIVTPQIAQILAPFETATAGRDSKDNFEWNFELEKMFRQAKESINNLVKLYLPSPDDQLIMETDAAKGGGKTDLPAGVGHVLYAVKDGQKHPVRIHSVKLPDKCKNWQPCEIEALAFAVGIDKEYDIIRESKHPLLIQPDSKPVHEAVNLINNGKFSSSARMSSFLTNVNRTRIISKHISGKAKLNPISDLQSRFPSECNSEYCSIHKFIDESVHGDIEDESRNCKIETVGFANRESWKNAQMSNQACSVAKQMLSSGKPPPKAIGKTSGEYWNDVRQYCRDATLAKDGLLIVKTKPDNLSGNISRERIVIPKPLVPALLYHQHNHSDQHPSKTQQKSLFQRQFYAIGLEKHLELLYRNCYKCSVIQKLPKEIIPNETKTVVDGPQTHFHADVIKRSQQNILTIRDHFSSFQDAILVNSEKACDLKDGLIFMTSTIRRPGQIFISVDNSPGFKSLMSNEDEDLLKLKITIVKTDEINKNANAVIDKGCQELEDEIKRLEPEGNKLSISTLKLAVVNLNSKLRRRGQISSFEINSARDQNTGINLNLDDKLLRNNQLLKRGEKVVENLDKSIEVGDTVRITNKNDKHKASEMFLVTSKDEEKVGVQKLLHPLRNSPVKLMSKVYKANEKHLTMIHRPSFPVEDEVVIEEYDHENSIEQVIDFNPINPLFYNDDETDDEYDDSQDPIVPHVENDYQSGSELHWDSSPEQYQLQQSSENDQLENALQPRQLFTGTSDDEEVFNQETFETPPSASPVPKLQRRNAMRMRQRPRKQPSSEPRVTRTMLQSGNFRQSVSNPTSPSGIELGPRVQLFTDALQNIQATANNVRRSSRNTEKVDYSKLHKYGKKN